MFDRSRIAIGLCVALSALTSVSMASPAFARPRRNDKLIALDHYTDFTIRSGVDGGHGRRLGV